MKIIIHSIPEATLEDFAENTALTMVVRERPNEAKGSPVRYWASFANAEVKEGRILASPFGNGATPDEAIQNYGPMISEHTLVMHAYSDRRYEIEVPRIITKPQP